MCRILATATIVTILAIGVAGRSILQDSGSASPTSFAQKNTNSQGTNSANTAVQQALQNQKTTQLQGRQTQIKPQVTAKKTLQQVNRFTSINLSQGSLLLKARPLARASSNEVQVMATVLQDKPVRDRAINAKVYYAGHRHCLAWTRIIRSLHVHECRRPHHTESSTGMPVKPVAPNTASQMGRQLNSSWH